MLNSPWDLPAAAVLRNEARNARNRALIADEAACRLEEEAAEQRALAVNCRRSADDWEHAAATLDAAQGPFEEQARAAVTAAKGGSWVPVAEGAELREGDVYVDPATGRIEDALTSRPRPGPVMRPVTTGG